MEYKHIALIPAYEPDSILLDILKQLKKQGLDIVLIDDGSGAAFSGIFSSASLLATVLTHPINRGKGASLKTGMKHIMENTDTNCIIVTVDADGQHRIEDAVRLCREAETCPGTLVLGSRRLKDHVPLKSRLGNTITRFIYRATTGLRVHDTQTGLRAFDNQLIPKLLSITGERYEYEMNTLMEFAREKIPIREVEIDTIYINHNSASHFEPVRDSIRICKEILKFSASSFVGFLIDYIIYGLLLLITGHLLAANIGARIVSASVNYTLNRKFVFKSKSTFVWSALQYFLLAAAVLIGNTLVLEFLVNYCGINQMVAKIFTEVIFFAVSWLVQKTVIFRKKE